METRLNEFISHSYYLLKIALCYFMDWISTWTGFGRNSEVVINLEALIHTHSKYYNLRERIFVNKNSFKIHPDNFYCISVIT